jgi:hypothetical protein
MRACCKTKSVIPSGRASAEVLQNEKGVPKWHKIKMSLPEEDRIALESKNPVSSSFPDVTNKPGGTATPKKAIYYMRQMKSK